MSIDSYSTLKTAITTWVDRSDLTDAVVSDFVSLAEARIGRRLRVRGVEARDTALVQVGSTAYFTLPTDFLEARNVQVNSSPLRVLKYLSPQQMDTMFPYSTSGNPSHFTIIGEQMQINSTPSSSVEIAYFKKLAALSDSNTTNWLTANAPDMLLYASLIEAETYLVNTEKAAVYAAMLDVSMQEWNVQDDKGRHSGSALASQTDTGNP
jgi:hypothetical protein